MTITGKNLPLETVYYYAFVELHTDSRPRRTTPELQGIFKAVPTSSLIVLEALEAIFSVRWVRRYSAAPPGTAVQVVHRTALPSQGNKSVNSSPSPTPCMCLQGWNCSLIHTKPPSRAHIRCVRIQACPEPGGTLHREIRRRFKERQYVARLGMKVETLYLTHSELGEEGNSMGEAGMGDPWPRLDHAPVRAPLPELPFSGRVDFRLQPGHVCVTKSLPPREFRPLPRFERQWLSQRDNVKYNDSD
ncbi:Protein Transport Protein Sec16A [Manis pentadactyla]|nr:Protein Transport Protein Sec16A [Manis pentadactyla]